MSVTAELLVMLQVTGDDEDVTLSSVDSTSPNFANFPCATSRLATAMGQLATVGVKTVTVVNGDYHTAASNEISNILTGWSVTTTVVPLNSQWDGGGWKEVDSGTFLIGYLLEYDNSTIIEQTNVPQSATTSVNSFLRACVMIQHT